jgi:hypothetical protein
MSNKSFNLLNEIDRKLRTHFPVGMNTPNVRLKIELLNGFEIFQTRPYHNLETWSDGYLLTDTETGVNFSAEDLDDAVDGFIKKVNEYRIKNNLKITIDRNIKVVEDVLL